jgi:serine/threonine-protein kinase
MGSVWLGRHVMTERQVAIKVLDERFLANAAVVQRFGREARAASAIQHEGIVEVLDLDMTEEGVPFLVMEFLDGESLAQRIERKGRLAEDELMRLSVQLLDALHAAHERGVVHRDLKPDNVFVVPAGRRGERVKLLDFGISSKVDEATAKLTVTGSVLGTPHYMSPEQASGEQDLDRRADIYATGVLLYECVVGKVPFDAPNYNRLLRTILEGNPASPIERGATISPALEAVILGAMNRQREKRPPTASALKQAMLAAHQGVGLSNESSSPGSLAAQRRSSDRPPAAVPSQPPPSQPQWDLSSLEASTAAPPTASRSRSRLPMEPSSTAAGLDDLGPSAPAANLEIDLGALEATRKARTSTPPSSPRVSRVSREGREHGSATSSSGDSQPFGREDEAPLPPAVTIGTRWAALEPQTRRWIIGTIGALVLFVVAVVVVRKLVRPDTVLTETVAALATSTPVADETPSSGTRDWVLVDVQGVPPGAQLRLDGLPGINLPLRIRRGTTHVLEIRATGYADRRLEVHGEDGATLRAELVPLVGSGELRK